MVPGSIKISQEDQWKYMRKWQINFSALWIFKNEEKLDNNFSTSFYHIETQ